MMRIYSKRTTADAMGATIPTNSTVRKSIAAVVVLLPLVAVAGCGTDAPLSQTHETSVASVATPSDVLPVMQYPPTRLQMPDLHIDAKVIAIDTSPDGVLTPPEDVDVVGWWAPGARPAGDGSTVLTAHVNDRSQGAGVFVDLGAAPVGADVTVTTKNATLRYAVTERHKYVKQALPKELFSISGPRRLVLITCGGEFDSAAGSYEDNIVVIATPA